MAIDREKLMQTATGGLRRLDVIATPVAVVAALLMIFVIDVQWSLAILLSLGVYAGVHLVLPERDVPPMEIPEPVAPEREDIARSRAASAKIAESISGLQKEATQEQVQIKEATQEQVQVIVTEIGMMMDAIEEDATENESRLAAAPLYYTRLVQPFGNFLERGLWLKRRKVRAADAQFEHFETEIVPRFIKAAQEFYQEYHNQDVLDLAALKEILMYNLDSIDEHWINGEYDDANSAE